MSRLIDADELLKEINIWCECVDGTCLLKDAPTVQAIPLDKLKEILDGYDGSIPSMITRFSEIQKLIESEERANNGQKEPIKSRTSIDRSR